MQFIVLLPYYKMYHRSIRKWENNFVNSEFWRPKLLKIQFPYEIVCVFSPLSWCMKCSTVIKGCQRKSQTISCYNDRMADNWYWKTDHQVSDLKWAMQTCRRSVFQVSGSRARDKTFMWLTVMPRIGDRIVKKVIAM